MSEQPDHESDLGPRPEAQIEPGEANPGGPDALEEMPDVDPDIPDLDPHTNPAVDDAPRETREGEDTSTEATRGEGSDGDDSAESSA